MKWVLPFLVTLTAVSAASVGVKTSGETESTANASASTSLQHLLAWTPNWTSEEETNETKKEEEDSSSSSESQETPALSQIPSVVDQEAEVVEEDTGRQIRETSQQAAAGRNSEVYHNAEYPVKRDKKEYDDSKQYEGYNEYSEDQYPSNYERPGYSEDKYPSKYGKPGYSDDKYPSNYEKPGYSEDQYPSNYGKPEYSEDQYQPNYEKPVYSENNYPSKYGKYPSAYPTAYGYGNQRGYSESSYGYNYAPAPVVILMMLPPSQPSYYPSPYKRVGYTPSYGSYPSFPSYSSYGSTYGAAPSYGSSYSAAAPSYGSAYGATPAYGSTYGAAPTYGSTYGTAPTYGSAYGATPVYGSTYAPVYGGRSAHSHKGFKGRAARAPMPSGRAFPSLSELQSKLTGGLSTSDLGINGLPFLSS